MTFEPNPEDAPESKLFLPEATGPSTLADLFKPKPSLSKQALDNLNQSDAALALKLIHSEEIEIISPDSLPETASNTIYNSIFGSDCTDSWGLEINILAVAKITENDDLFSNEDCAEYYSAIVTVKDTSNHYWMPSCLGNGENSIQNATTSESKTFTGYYCQLNLTGTEISVVPFLGPTEEKKEFSKIRAGDLSGLLGEKLLSPLIEMNPVFAKPRSLYNMGSCTDHNISFIAELNKQYLAAYVWGDDQEFLKYNRFYALFSLDPTKALKNELTSDLPDEFGFTIIDGIALSLKDRDRINSTITSQIHDAAEILASRYSAIKDLIKIKLPSIDSVEIRASAAWHKQDLSGQSIQTILLVNIYDTKENIITIGPSCSDNAGEKTTGISILITDINSADDPDGEFENIDIAYLNLHEAVWKEQLLSLCSNNGKSGVLHSLLTAQIEEYCYDKSIKFAGSIEFTSILITPYDESTEYEYYLLCRTQHGDFLAMIDIQENGGELDLDDGIQVVHFFAKSEPIRCLNFPEIDL